MLPAGADWSAGVQLTVLSNYRSRDAAYTAGQVIDVDDATAQWLMVDAPGCFAPVRPEPVPEPEEGEGKVLEQPPVDRQMRSGRRKRAGGSE